MKKRYISLLYAAACLLIGGCAHTIEESTNDADKRYFDAWIALNAPGVKPEGLGVYVIDEKEGNGTEVTSDGYALVDYIASDLEGNISSYTSSQTAEQLGTHVETSYYGPKFWLTTDADPAKDSMGQSQPSIVKMCGGWVAATQQRRGSPTITLISSSKSASAVRTTAAGGSQIVG